MIQSTIAMAPAVKGALIGAGTYLVLLVIWASWPGQDR